MQKSTLGTPLLPLARAFEGILRAWSVFFVYQRVVRDSFRKKLDKSANMRYNNRIKEPTSRKGLRTKQWQETFPNSSEQWYLTMT